MLTSAVLGSGSLRNILASHLPLSLRIVTADPEFRSHLGRIRVVLMLRKSGGVTRQFHRHYDQCSPGIWRSQPHGAGPSVISFLFCLCLCVNAVWIRGQRSKTPRCSERDSAKTAQRRRPLFTLMFRRGLSGHHHSFELPVPENPPCWIASRAGPTDEDESPSQ